MEAGLVIYFLALAVLARVFFKLSKRFMSLESDDEEVQVGGAILGSMFFIAFVVVIIVMANTGYDLVLPKTSLVIPWVPENLT